MLSETQNPKPARDMALINGDDDFDIAGRSIGEINARITRLQSEAEGGLDELQARAIQNFLQLAGPAASVSESIASLLDNASALEGFTDYWQRLFAAAGLPMDGDSTGREIILAPAEGRKMAYYTGLAFEIHVPALGTQRVIASGGRYDDLLQSLGAAQIIPAIGGAIALERLQTAAQQQGGA
jgi:ATP phosphoribosyltransferase regulatory subunit